MKMYAFSVFDKAVNAFMPPFFVRHPNEAIRSFTDLCNDKKTNVGNHPLDFDLCKLGEWDDNSGMFDGSSPVRLVSAVECLADSGAGEISALRQSNGDGRFPA